RTRTGKYAARFQFAGRRIVIPAKATAEEAFRCAMAAVERVREQDAWLDQPLPPGVVVRASGYAVRYWHRDQVQVVSGPFPTPQDAAAMLPVNVMAEGR